ncbi:hypothetical protein YC2023_115069 [Brassica napus]
MAPSTGVIPHPPFPHRMFAIGDEPLGCINKILNAFDEHEVAFIKESQFGKLVEIDWR